MSTPEQVVAHLRSASRGALMRCYVRGPRDAKAAARKSVRREVMADLERTLELFPEQRAKRLRTVEPEADLGDAGLQKLAWLTDSLDLKRYEPFLHLVPRIVNVVSLGEATPEPGTGTALPLDLRKVASKLTNAYYAPRRFAAVQTRDVLLVHRRLPLHVFGKALEAVCLPQQHRTRGAALRHALRLCAQLAGDATRLTHFLLHAAGTGTSGTAEARLSIARAVRQLAVEAGVFLRVARFETINIVGAMNLQATLNCAAFAEAHRSSAHYDKSSFVGLAFRPEGEACVTEIYSSGRANLPGSQNYRDLVRSTYNMLPALLKYSSAAALLDKFPPKDRSLHEGELRGVAVQALAEDRAEAWGAAQEEDEEVDGFGGGLVDSGLLDALPL